MGKHATSTAPGAFAQERFRARRRAWWQRIWWAFPLFAAFLIAISVGLGFLFMPDHLGFYWGLGLGLACAMTIVLADSPPHHIERWRQGAEGEKATAKALRPLVRDGWTLVNDIDTGRGNVDHVLVGPPGIFLLESKNLLGVLSVHAGVLTVRWREDPDDGYENFRLARQMRARALELELALQRQGVQARVQPVVVLWGGFAQRSILSKNVAWIDGKELRRVLRSRPVRLDSAEVQCASAAVAAAWPPDAD